MRSITVTDSYICNMTKLPVIRKQDLDQASAETWDYLFLILDQYYTIIAADPSEETFRAFNASQHTLMAFNTLYGQVTNGGFVQLIQNGNGGYIFENPFAEGIRAWGATAIADLVDQAGLIYREHKEDLERETTLEAFSEMYKDYPGFELLEDTFYEVVDGDTEIIRKYVADHITDFVRVD